MKQTTATSEPLKASQVIIQNLLHNLPVRAQAPKEKHRRRFLAWHILPKNPRVNAAEKTLRAQLIASICPFLLCLRESLDNTIGDALSVAVREAVYMAICVSVSATVSLPKFILFGSGDQVGDDLDVSLDCWRKITEWAVGTRN
jgi:hypothetical protein